jgi:hypothetical protein
MWEAAIGAGYSDWLTASELTELGVLFQKRHLPAHREGLVDEKYVRKSGDATYRVRQRIVVAPEDAMRMVTITEKLGTSLRAALSAGR